ncbi:hypothetical protein N9J88_04120 [Porticoccaceae bacterium]|nr:hypothetical protein [Porticoccaceae bacterium]
MLVAAIIIIILSSIAWFLYQGGMDGGYRDLHDQDTGEDLDD